MYSDKMVKVEPKQIALTDKLIETRNNKASFQIDQLSVWLADFQKAAIWLASINLKTILSELWTLYIVVL